MTNGEESRFQVTVAQTQDVPTKEVTTERGTLLPESARQSGERHPPLERIGNYRLQTPLGKGGMGEVWLAVHAENHNLKAAVKFIRTDAQGKSAAARFERERESLIRLRHENIIR